MTPLTTLRKALADPNLLGGSLAGDSWSAWRTLLIAAMGEPLTDDERVLFKQLTGRDTEPGQRVHELACVIGRRGGKSRAMATLAVWLAGLCDHVLAPGETGVLLCVALDLRVAKIILDYCEATFEASPLLRQLIAGRTGEALLLTNGISIEVRPASFRKLRGPTYIAVIADELAFWYVDQFYANPDTEILAAVRPGLLTTRGPLILASSPYAKRGVLWDIYHNHYGANGAPLILVAKGTTRDFNSTVPQADVDRALEADRARNTAEYLAEFRTDVDSFVNLDAVTACTGDFLELLPDSRHNYRAFVDAAGGSGDDCFTCAVAHRWGEQVIVDAVREIRPPFSPQQAIAEIAAFVKSYRCSRVVGDRWGGGFPPETFSKYLLSYEPATKTKSDFYRDLLPLLNSGAIVLPKHDRLINQIVGLERRVAHGGRDSIDHPPNGHDDLANAVAGAAQLAFSYNNYDTTYAGFNSAPLEESPRDAEIRQQREQRYAELLVRYGQPCVNNLVVPR